MAANGNLGVVLVYPRNRLRCVVVLGPLIRHVKRTIAWLPRHSAAPVSAGKEPRRCLDRPLDNHRYIKF